VPVRDLLRRAAEWLPEDASNERQA
jgi:hypothetical protein